MKEILQKILFIIKKLRWWKSTPETQSVDETPKEYKPKISVWLEKYRAKRKIKNKMARKSRRVNRHGC